MQHSLSKPGECMFGGSLLGDEFALCGGVGSSISTISSSESIISTLGRCVEDCLGVGVVSLVRSTTESLSLTEEVELTERGLPCPELVNSSVLSLTNLCGL